MKTLETASLICFGLVGVLGGVFVAAALCAGTGCVNGKLAPATEQAAVAGAALACAEEAAIPTVGQVLVLACPAEVAGVRALLDRFTATPSPAASPIVDAGAPAKLTASAPLFKRTSTGALAHVGWVPAGTPAAHAEQLARACLGSLPTPALPVVDAGAEGGR